jgi:hypothetical protein
MSANALPSGVALAAIALVAVLFTASVVVWHRFGPKNRTLHNLLGGLSPQFARLITADYAEQVLSAEPDGALAQLAYLGLATSRAYASGRASLDELHAVARALSRAYGADFAKIAGLANLGEESSVRGPDLVDLARRLGLLGFSADFVGHPVLDLGEDRPAEHKPAEHKLHLSVTSAGSGAFVGKAVACACAEEPKPFLAAQYARAAWKNRQSNEVGSVGLPGMPSAGATTAWSVPAGRSTVVGPRSGAELIDSQIELAGHYAYSRPPAMASVARASGQFDQPEQAAIDPSERYANDSSGLEGA